MNYKKTVEHISSNSLLCNLILYSGKAITLFIYLLYPCFLVYIFAVKRIYDLSIVLFPLVGFIVLSIFRRIYNADRPYEVYGYVPIGGKDTKGRSFPSRHCFSILIISFSVLEYFTGLGIFLMVLSFILCFIRVISGIHFIKDVVAAVIFATVLGLSQFIIF